MSTHRPPRRPVRSAAVVAVAVALLTGTGCSSAMNHDSTASDGSALPAPSASATPTLGLDTAKERTAKASTQVLDLIGIPTGKVTEPGPTVDACAEDPEHLYKTRHPWSVSGVSDDELKAGFERLRTGLPGAGWKVVDYGRNDSRAKNLELTADSGTGPFAVNAELMLAKPGGTRATSLIMVNIVSGCWRAPAGTDLSTQY